MKSILSVLLLGFGAPAFAAGANEPAAWSTSLHDAHRARIDAATSTLDALVAAQPTDTDAQAQADLVALRATAPTPIGEANLGGAWRVRSLQVQPDMIYAYPYFNARLDADGDAWSFVKTTGSQRRSGRLFRDADDPERLVFLGGSSVNDDPSVAYSDAATGIDPQDSDSVGVLHRLGPAHLILILDAEPGDSVEVYELRR